MRVGTKIFLIFCALSLVAGSAVGGEQRVVINEVAWGGGPSDAMGEWIELLNTTGGEVSLEGWRLISSDGCPDVLLHGSIPAFWPLPP